MRLCTYVLKGGGREGQSAGLVEGSLVRGVVKRSSLLDLISSGGNLSASAMSGESHPLGAVSLMAPLPRPGKIIAAIVNTQGMLGGAGVELERPRLDMKAPSTVVGPGEAILDPGTGMRPEVELAAVVGKTIRRASASEAESSIAGYTILNDVTAPSDSREDAYEAYRRDSSSGTIRKTVLRGPLFRSKNHDTFCPMGPWVVTPDELDVSDLRMTTRFDGALVQEGSTSEYLFSPARLASYVSGFLTLDPGDIVSCGSVGWTKDALGNRDPTEYTLPRRAGTLELEIEGIGKLLNPVLRPD